MRPHSAALAAVLLFPAPARALTNAQLENQVRKERRDYDLAKTNLQKKEDALAKAEKRLDALHQEFEDGRKRDNVGGACLMESCIKRQEKKVAAQEKAAAAALKKAQTEAQQYTDKEDAYMEATGHYYDPKSMTGASDFLNPQTNTGPGIKPPCLDSRGVPCIPDGTDKPPVGTNDPPPGPGPGHTTPTQEAGQGADSGSEGGFSGGHDSKVGSLGTGHEADDLSKYAAKGAQSFDAAGSHSLGSTGGGALALGAGREEGRPLTGGYDAVASGRAALALGAATEALAAARRALRANPNSAEAHLLDADARNAVGDWAGAEAAARRSIGLNPSSPDAYKSLAVSLLHQGKTAEALDAANKALERDPNDAAAYMLRAFAFEGLGRKAEMMKDVEKAASLDPARFAGYLKLARMGKVLFDRRRTMKGWHGFPVPDVGAPDTAGAEGPHGPSGAMKLGGLLILVAAVLLGVAAFKNRRDPNRVKI